MTRLSSFRIVRLSNELQGEFDLPEFVCANPESMPFPEGQAFYHWVVDDNACEPVTAYNYLNTILPFFTFLWFGSSSLRFTASAAQIRNRVRDYLKEKLGCAVRPHPGGNFTVRSKTITAASVRLFLTALKRFYTCAILKGWYADINPLAWTTRLAAQDRTLKPKMPPRSGMTLPENKRGRVPDTYFCVVSGDWRPRIIDDPNLPRLLLAAFERPRDRLVTRILFESGARVSEVLGLTLGDWRSRGQRERALTTDKGSRGERVKEIWWSSTTSRALRNYINNDRRRHDPKGQRLNDLPNSAPLFVTDNGEPYTYKAFYYNWKKACDKVDLRVTPHQARHWFVTMSLHRFESLPGDKRESARQALIAYMGWRNPETIKAYDHHIRKLDFASTHAALTRLIESGDRDLAAPQSSDTATWTKGTISKEMGEWLDQLLEDE
jgi:integrase